MCIRDSLYVEGIYTHFSTADEKDKQWTFRQKQLFDEFIAKIEAKGYRIPLKHAANSAATIDLPETHYDMVRAGMIMYGYYPSEDVSQNYIDVLPALSLRARVSCVKRVPKGTAISYGRKYITDRCV